MNAVVQVLLEAYSDYLQWSPVFGPYHGYLAHLHGLVVNRAGTIASAEALVRQLELDKVLKLINRKMPEGADKHIRVRQDDAQRVLWIMLDKLADEVR